MPDRTQRPERKEGCSEEAEIEIKSLVYDNCEIFILLFLTYYFFHLPKLRARDAGKRHPIGRRPRSLIVL